MKHIAAALLAIQADAPTLQKTAINPHYKNRYIPLDELADAVRPVLTKHGVVLVQMPTTLCDDRGFRPALSTRLIHAESGEQIEETMLLLATKDDPQAQGSALTYARRYSLMAALGLVADEDDDANAAAKASPAIAKEIARSVRPRPEPLPPQHADEYAPKSAAGTITEKQRRHLFAVAAEANMPRDALRAIVETVAGVESTLAIPAEKYEAVLAAVKGQAT